MIASTPDAQGIGSVETGVRVLGTIARGGEAMSLSDIARQLDMTPARLHRYLASLIRGGYVVQRHRGGRYDLGPAALELGIRAIRRVDPHAEVWRASRNLGDELQLGVAVSVWVDMQPAIIAHHHGPAPVSVSARPGQRLPALHTAVGRTFLAYMEPSIVERILTDQYDTQAPPMARTRVLSKARFIEELARIQSRGIAAMHGALAAHINALAAPVFDQWGAVCMVISVLADQSELDADPDGATAQTLKQAAMRASNAVGFLP